MSLKLFLVVWLLLAAQRLAELVRSKANERVIQSQGGYEAFPGHFQLMRLLHVAWFVAMLVEVWGLHRPARPFLVLLGLVCLLAGQGLRLWAIRTLGVRWSVRIMVLPGAPLIESGPFVWLRHPNYLGVVLEMFGVPLLHGTWLTAIVFSCLNGLLLTYRIRCEELALGR